MEEKGGETRETGRVSGGLIKRSRGQKVSRQWPGVEAGGGWGNFG